MNVLRHLCAVGVLFWSKIWAAKRWWEREEGRWFWISISYTEVGWLLVKTEDDGGDRVVAALFCVD